MPDPPEVADLYTVAPEQFVSVRDHLVRTLRAAGDKAEAARVAKMRRPPLTAWAFNQAARTSPALIEQLVAAGDGLRAATEQALRGDASALRTARSEERAAVDAVVAEAARRLEQGGYSATEALRQRMAATLRAAIVEPAVADLLRQARLVSDHEAPGFGMDALSGPGPQPAPGPGAQPAPEPAPGPPGPQPSESGPPAPEPILEPPGPQPPVDGPPGDDEAHQDARRRALDAERTAVDAEGEAASLAAEAEHLGEEADRLTAQAEQVRRQAAAARQRADEAAHAAAAARAQAATLASLANV